MRNGLIASALGGMILPVLFGSGPVEVKLTPEIREYCHVVRFAPGWRIPDFSPRSHQPLFYEYDSAYEFRTVGIPETKFLVGGVELPSKVPTINKYSIDLSDPAGIAQPATEEEWKDASQIPDSLQSDRTNFGSAHLTNKEALRFGNYDFVKSGDIWRGDYARLSPDKALIALLSSSGKVAQRTEFLPLGGRDKGKFFFDIFNTHSGKKLITIIAAYLDIAPGQAINQCRWVTERYFIVPLGEHRERCLVCDFGRAGQNEVAGR